MPSNRKQFSYYPSGFSLVEIMVGLVIGLLVTLVILQVFSVYEGQKRTTTGTADAQTNGGIALFSIVRDLKIAGYGLLPTSSSNSAINCANPLISVAAATSVTKLDPVTITDGGGGLSDTITIRYGDSAAAGTPVLITAPPAGNLVTLSTNLGCNPSPSIAVLITGATTCNVNTVTGLIGTTQVNVDDPTGAAANTVSLACLGNWHEITYLSNAGNLERDVYGMPTTPTVADIVNIQAQYGVSATQNSNKVVQWVDATGIWAAGTINIANRNLIKAVRIAVIARNNLREKTQVTNSYNGLACDPTTLDSTAPQGVCAWVPLVTTPNPSPAPNVDLSGTLDWQQYRYRVFETIVPLRNMIWSDIVLP